MDTAHAPVATLPLHTGTTARPAATDVPALPAPAALAPPEDAPGTAWYVVDVRSTALSHAA